MLNLKQALNHGLVQTQTIIQQKKNFSGNLLEIEIKITQILMNKPVYLGLSILKIIKTVMYEFWYYYGKLKYEEKAELCSMDTGSFIIYIKQE